MEGLVEGLPSAGDGEKMACFALCSFREHDAECCLDVLGVLSVEHTPPLTMGKESFLEGIGLRLFIWEIRMEVSFQTLPFFQTKRPHPFPLLGNCEIGCVAVVGLTDNVFKHRFDDFCSLQFRLMILAGCEKVSSSLEDEKFV